MANTPNMAAEEEARAARALAREGRVSAVVGHSGQAPLNDDPQTPEERVELVFVLTRAAWAMTGLPWPNVPRSQWPIKVRVLGEEP